MEKRMYTPKSDAAWMALAATLAQRGEGAVGPNPLVGAVIVRDGQLLAEGWHERWGGPHAERNALAHCTESPAGSTVYVTLEPCCHYGKTPPCTEALIEARVARVVVGLTDPNPLVAGRGIARLREAGIEVTTGVLADELAYQNRVFLKFITERRPWVVMKSAMTLDGKIATFMGQSHWVTGPEARQRVHEMRRRYMAIMVGIGTVLTDDPMLNCRLLPAAAPDAPQGLDSEQEPPTGAACSMMSQEGTGRQPVRIVVDSLAHLPLESKLVVTARPQRTILAHIFAAPTDRVEALRAAGVETWCCASQEGHVDLRDLMRQVGEAGIDSILLEGGGMLNAGMLRAGMVDEVACFIAPKLVGGRDAKTPVEGRGVVTMDEAWHITNMQVEKIGEDLLVSGLIPKTKECSQES
jgi:diaminohydroxyphosphoribosylaminopyrimidine deaminase/5-amino-6-(5-phosphoribosylamino)uracil reductase